MRDYIKITAAAAAIAAPVWMLAGLIARVFPGYEDAIYIWPVMILIIAAAKVAEKLWNMEEELYAGTEDRSNCAGGDNENNRRRGGMAA